MKVIEGQGQGSATRGSRAACGSLSALLRHSYSAPCGLGQLMAGPGRRSHVGLEASGASGRNCIPRTWWHPCSRRPRQQQVLEEQDTHTLACLLFIYLFIVSFFVSLMEKIFVLLLLFCCCRSNLGQMGGIVK